MMDKEKNILAKDAIELLSELGLNKYESLVYFNLVSEGISTAKNISNIAGIPYGKVYEIINSLSDKGFCSILPSKPMRCQAISPKKALNIFKSKTIKNLERLNSKFENILEPTFQKNKSFLDSASRVQVISGRYQVIKKIDECIQNASKNINIYCSENSLSRLVVHKFFLLAAQERGAKVNIAGVITDNNKSDVKSLSFCKIRQIKKSTNNFFSFDGKICFLIEPLPDDDDIKYGRDTAIHMISTSFTGLLDILFYQSFKQTKEPEMISLNLK